MAKTKVAFKSNNSKHDNGQGQGNKNNNKAAAPAPKRPMRSTGRGQ